MLCMEPFSVVKIKFKMQFCNLDELGLSTLTYSNTSYVSFNLPFHSFWSISVNFRVHFGRFGQLGSCYIGLFLYILINKGQFNNFEKFWVSAILINFVSFWLVWGNFS